MNAHSAAWLRSMDSASTYLHPDFGPNPGGFPYGIPYNIVTNSHPLVPITFQYASESDKGPYPFGPDTLIEGGKNAGGDRHAIMVNKDHVHALRTVGGPVLGLRLDGRIRRDLEA